MFQDFFISQQSDNFHPFNKAKYFLNMGYHFSKYHYYTLTFFSSLVFPFNSIFLSVFKLPYQDDHLTVIPSPERQRQRKALRKAGVI